MIKLIEVGMTILSVLFAQKLSKWLFKQDKAEGSPEDYYETLKQLPDGLLRWCEEENSWLVSWMQPATAGAYQMDVYYEGMTPHEVIQEALRYHTQFLQKEPEIEHRQPIQSKDDLLDRIGDRMFVSMIVGKHIRLRVFHLQVRDIDGQAHYMDEGVINIAVLSFDDSMDRFLVEFQEGELDGVQVMLRIEYLKHLCDQADSIQ